MDRSTYRKHDAKGGSWLNGYVLVQFVLTLAGTAWFLFSAGQHSIAEQVGLSALVVSTLMSLGYLLENRRWARYVEVLRIGGVGGALCYFLPNPALALGLGGLYLIASVVWLGVGQWGKMEVRSL